VKIEGRRTVELLCDLTDQLEGGAQLPEGAKGCRVVICLFNTGEKRFYAAMEGLQAVEEGIGLGCSLGVRCQSKKLRYVPL
jgi:hypothetical protein